MAQDRRVHALVYFCGTVGDLLGAVLHWRLDLEFADMTQEDIIRMAREAGLEEMWELTPRFVERLEAFAALVAAAEFAKREWNFCERCGKRTADLTVIHTCTPPQENI
jgi:hypothetical protein